MGYMLIGIGLLVAGILLLQMFSKVTARNIKLLAISTLFLVASVALVLFVISGRYGLAAPAGAIALWGMRAYLLARQIKATAQNAGQTHQQTSGKPLRADMTRAEALDILGLKEGASDAEIEAAYKALIVKNHPDQGGSDWLAARLNEARDFLLKD